MQRWLLQLRALHLSHPPPPLTFPSSASLPPCRIVSAQVEGQADCEGDVPRPVGLGQREPGRLPDGGQRGGAQGGNGKGAALSSARRWRLPPGGCLAGRPGARLDRARLCRHGCRCHRGSAASRLAALPLLAPPSPPCARTTCTTTPFPFHRTHESTDLCCGIAPVLVLQRVAS